MSEQNKCRRVLLEQAGELRDRLRRLMDGGAGREAEIETLRAKLGELETRMRDLSRPGGPLDELRQGAGRAVGELKDAWRKATSRMK